MSLIPGLTIVEDFISEQEEKELLNYINTKSWLNSLSRRVQHYGFEYDYKSPQLKPAIPIPEIFSRYYEKIGCNFNQVIVNEYEPGQGIGKHTDHKKLFGDTIASISLGSATSFIFGYGNVENEFYVKPRTLILMEGDARWKYYHYIPSRKSDTINDEIIKRKTRISITFRIAK
jgi:alkylated DNA repair dioxygenase AlkB